MNKIKEFGFRLKFIYFWSDKKRQKFLNKLYEEKFKYRLRAIDPTCTEDDIEYLYVCANQISLRQHKNIEDVYIIIENSFLAGLPVESVKAALKAWKQ